MIEKHPKEYPKVGLSIIVTRGNEVLIGKRKGAHGAGSWSFPGGHLEFGEALEDAVKRELQEEANIKTKNIDFVTATNDIDNRENKHYVTLFFKGEYDSGEVKVNEPDRCESWIWVEWKKIPKPRFLGVKNLIKTGYNPFKN